MHDCLALLHRHQNPELACALRKNPPVCTANFDQRSTVNAVREAVNQMINSVGAVNFELSYRVAERKHR